MTDEEFRLELLACAASRAESHSLGMREALVSEIAERLWEANELPELELCTESLAGQRNRRLEIDAYAFDEADQSLHFAVAIFDGLSGHSAKIRLTDAREQGFGRAEGVYEQSRSGWITRNTEESRPLWALARLIETRPIPTALRLHVFTDRLISERVREIPSSTTSDRVPITFQIWDASRLRRIQQATSARDDLVVDFSDEPAGGLPVLPAALESDYQGYLAVIPGHRLADIYIRHGSRLLEGNVRTFLGRRGSTNKGIAQTLIKEPARFFAFNNGIAATASAVTTKGGGGSPLVVVDATDLQIVNGAQTTASLASLRREGKLKEDGVFVAMKLSVVSLDTAEVLIPRISRFSNTQNAVKASDFFANHEFHRRIEQISRRILAPAKPGSQIQTHWYYERARGQYLNDQAGMSAAKRDQFNGINPRGQVVTKTDLAKVETSFDGLPDLACRGAEKAFVAFAERVTQLWQDEAKRALYTDDWYRSAVARIILFRAAEGLVSKAPWYAPGTRAQVVAHSVAKLANMGAELTQGGHIDYLKIWSRQAADPALQEQLLVIAEMVMGVLTTPPLAGQNVGEWAKQQACRKKIFETEVLVVDGLNAFLVEKIDAAAQAREQRADQRVADGLSTLTEVINRGGEFWTKIRSYARKRGGLSPADEAALAAAAGIPRRLPTEAQASRVLDLLAKFGSEESASI